MGLYTSIWEVFLQNKNKSTLQNISSTAFISTSRNHIERGLKYLGTIAVRDGANRARSDDSLYRLRPTTIVLVASFSILIDQLSCLSSVNCSKARKTVDIVKQLAYIWKV